MQHRPDLTTHGSHIDPGEILPIEQDRAGIHDPAHFAYPTYAKAAIARRENLKRSIDELRIQLEDAKSALGEAFDDLKKLELLDVRDQMRERESEPVPEPSDLHGLLRHDRIARSAQRVHVSGKPISQRANSGFKCAPLSVRARKPLGI